VKPQGKRLKLLTSLEVEIVTNGEVGGNRSDLREPQLNAAANVEPAREHLETRSPKDEIAPDRETIWQPSKLRATKDGQVSVRLEAWADARDRTMENDVTADLQTGRKYAEPSPSEDLQRTADVHRGREISEPGTAADHEVPAYAEAGREPLEPRAVLEFEVTVHLQVVRETAKVCVADDRAVPEGRSRTWRRAHPSSRACSSARAPGRLRR